MEEPDVFYTDCDLIAEIRKYYSCIQCYRYETCKSVWEKENKESE